MNDKRVKLIIFLLFVINIFIFGLFLTLKFKNKNLEKELNVERNNNNNMKIMLNNIEKEKENLIVSSEEKIINPATKIPIITFHRVVDHETKEKYFKDSEWVNDATVTEEELKYLYDNNWKSIDLDEFYCWYNKDCEFDQKTFVITIDDGDSEAYYIVLPILKKFNFKATLFAIGKDIPEVTEELNEPNRQKLGRDKIEELRRDNSLLKVESHTYALHSELPNGKGIVSKKTKEEILDDFKQNEKYGFKYLAYPFGYYDDKFLEVISQYPKIKMAFIFKKKDYAKRKNNKYEISRLKVNGKMKLNDFKKIFKYAESISNN